MPDRPVDIYPALKPRYEHFERQIALHTQAFSLAYSGGDVPLYFTDFVFVALLNRSISLIEGVRTLTACWNLLAAMPLLRLQIDNILRMAYLLQTKKPEDFCRELIMGTPTNKIPDYNSPNQKQKLSDGTLRNYAKKTNERLSKWLDVVYDDTSKFVHFSDRHFLTSIGKVGPGEREVWFHVGRPGYSIEARSPSYEDFDVLLGTMGEATDILLEMLCGYAAYKRQFESRRLSSDDSEERPRGLCGRVREDG